MLLQACTAQQINNHLIVKVDKSTLDNEGLVRKDLSFEKKIGDTLFFYYGGNLFNYSFLRETPAPYNPKELFKNVLLPNPKHRTVLRKVKKDFYFQPYKERPSYWVKLYSFDRNEKIQIESRRPVDGKVLMIDGHKYSGKDTIIKINENHYKCGVFYKGGAKDTRLYIHKKSGVLLYEKGYMLETICIEVVPFKDTTRIIKIFENRKKYKIKHTR